jgi:hypothetical protein
LVALAATSHARVASAQEVDDATRSAARNLGLEGVQAYQANDFAGANEKLERAYRVLRAPSLGLWAARALVKIDHLVEAGERYLEVTRLPISGGDEAVQRQAKADAQSELDALTPRIPNIVVQVDGGDTASVTVTIDGVPLNTALIGVGRPVDPGAHHVSAARGAERAELDVDIHEGERKPALLHFGAPAAPNAITTQPAPLATTSGDAGSASRPQETAHPLRVVGLVTAGVGLVGVAVGSVFGLSAKSSNDQSNSGGHCDASGCDDVGTGHRNDALRAARVSTALFIGGGALLAGGVTLYLVGGSHSKEASLAFTPVASGDGAGLRIHGGF